MKLFAAITVFFLLCDSTSFSYLGTKHFPEFSLQNSYISVRLGGEELLKSSFKSCRRITIMKEAGVPGENLPVHRETMLTIVLMYTEEIVPLLTPVFY